MVSLLNVVAHNNPGTWGSALQFEIEFEVLLGMEAVEVEFKLTWIGSIEQGTAADQELDTALVGPMGPGRYKIMFQADPPDLSLIPPEELLGVTGLLLTMQHGEDGPTFVQVGYYVRVDYDSAELNAAVEAGNAPSPPLPERLVRTIDADKPRVTRYQIDWDAPPEPSAMAPEEEAMVQEAMMEPPMIEPPPEGMMDMDQPDAPQSVQSAGQAAQPDAVQFQYEARASVAETPAHPGAHTPPPGSIQAKVHELMVGGAQATSDGASRAVGDISTISPALMYGGVSPYE